jgi:hypothetical protein
MWLQNKLLICLFVLSKQVQKMKKLLCRVKNKPQQSLIRKVTEPNK